MLSGSVSCEKYAETLSLDAAKREKGGRRIWVASHRVNQQQPSRSAAFSLVLDSSPVEVSVVKDKDARGPLVLKMLYPQTSARRADGKLHTSVAERFFAAPFTGFFFGLRDGFTSPSSNRSSGKSELV